MRFLIPSVIMAAAITVPGFAHDMWIEPATFAPQSGQIVSLRLRVGQDLIGDPIPRIPALFQEFVVEGAAGRKPVVGRDGGDPAGFVRAEGPGLLVVGYRSNQNAIEVPAETFNQYLKEEGLDAVALLRKKRNETSVAARELFSRCAKSLLLSGVPAASQTDRVLGFPLELTAERNPYTLREGEELPVRLTYENRPLAGALVVAMNRSNPAEKIAVRTGKDGRVRLKLARGGMWLIKSVHMIPAAANTNANWESFWASITFETTTVRAAK